jgi:methionyl-tRNA synthetase
MDAFALHEGAAAAYRLIDATNEFIADTAPWRLAKDPAAAARLTQALFDAAEAIRLAAVMLAPIMPTASAEILRRVGVSADGLRLDRDGRWRAEGERVLAQAPALWPRLDRSSTEEPMTVQPIDPTPAVPPSAAAPVAAPAAPAADRISIDDFMKIELRVARVLAAERVPNSKKLIRMQVDVGTEQRTIVAGIAEAYEPDALVGRSVVVVLNLKPVKLMGIESNGMVLAASADDGKPVLVGFDDAPPPGTRVR